MGTRTVSVLTLLALSLNATAALASDAPAVAGPFGNRDMEGQVDLSEAYQPEAVYVTSLAAGIADGNVTGSFTVENTEETLVTGLQYRIELRGIGEEDGLPYGIDVVRASVALAPLEAKKLLFATPLPNVPAGRYDLRVQLLTAKGRSLGWMDSAVVVTDEFASADFVKLFPGTIGIEAYGDELLPPLSGPNADPSTPITLGATAINGTDHAIRVIPVVEVFEFNAARVGLGSFEYSALNLAAGKELALSLPLTTEAVPGTYMAHLTLKDAETLETISTIAQYRFVVKGEDADIVAVRIEDMGTKSGDWAYGSVDIAGSADALTTTVATLRVQILDDAGVVGSIDVPGIELTDSILSAKIRIPLTRDLVGSPTVNASLLSSSNATFDHVTYAGTLTPAQLASITQNDSFGNWVAWHGMARIALFAFVAMAIGYALFLLASRMRGSLAFARTATAAFLLVAMLGANVGSTFAAGSGGIETLTPVNGSAVFAPLGNRPIIALFINSPVHGQSNNFCNRQVQLSYRLEYGVCENEIAYARVIGRVTRNGGHLTAYDVPGTQWETVHNRTYQSQFCGQAFCFQTENFNGTLDLSNAVDPSANTATLQLVAKWGKNIAMPDANFDRNDVFINLGWAHAMNVHLQCTPPQLDVQKTVSSGAVTPGGTVTYTFAVTNTGQSNAGNVVLNDVFLNGNTRYMPFEYVSANGASCAFDSGAVQTSCSVGTLTPGQTKTFTATFRVPQNQPQLCGQTVRNRVEARVNNQSAGSATAEAQTSVVCPPSYGCIEVFKEGFTADNQRITGPLPAFQFKLDGQINASSDQGGFARFENVQPGTHTVTELAAAGWTNFLVTPDNGRVVVAAGSNCAGVTFKNRQDPQDADLQIQKSGPTSVVRGTTATYSIVVKNNGPASAPNTIVGDPLPAGTTFVAAQSDNRCSLQGTTVFCNLGTMTANQQISLQITLDVPNPTPQTCQAGSIVNRASVLSDRQDRNIQNNESSFTTQAQCPQPQVGCIDIFKEAFTAGNQRIPAPIQPFTFKLDGNQTMTSDAQGNARFSNVTPGTHVVTEVTQPGWTNFLVTPDNGQVVVAAGTNCAGVTFKNRQNPTDADLQLVKTGPASITRGSTVLYSLAVKNNGPTAAPNTIVRDELPAGTTFVAAQSDSRCTLQGNSIACTLGTLTVGQTMTVAIALNVPATYAGSTVVNRAAVLSDLVDNNLQNNQSTVTTPVTSNVGCIDIFKEGFDAGGSRLSTVPPFKFILNGSGGVFVHTNSAGNARFSNVPVGQHTVSEVTGSGWNLFNITPTGGVVNVQNGPNCAGVVFKNKQIPQNADVSIVKSGPQTAVRGGTLTYSLTVTNLGPAVAQNVEVNDAIPSGLTNPVVSGQNCTVNNGTVRCVIGTMQPGDQRIITINLTVPAATGTCQTGTVTNTGTVTSQNDTQGANNSSSVTTQLQCPNPQNADLQIQKSGPTSVVRGQNASYTLIVKNNGPTAAPNTIVGDPLPAGTTFVAAQSDSRCTLQNTTVFCNLGTMAVSQQISLQITLNIPNTNPQSCQPGTVLNRAAVLSDLQDPSTANNESTFTTQVTCPNPATADVSVAKTGATTVQRGTNISYSITVSNLGPATASGVVLTDAVPTGLTFVSADTGCTLINGVVTCQVGTLTTSTPRTFTLVFSTGSATPTCSSGTVVNTAIVTAASTDPVSANNQSHVTTQIACPGGKDVQIVKTGSGLVTRGSNFSYTLTVTNNGPATATGVVVTDVIPSGLNFVSASAECSQSNGTVTCQAGTIPSGQFRSFTITVNTPTLAQCSQTSVTNTATVVSSGTDTNTANNSSSVTTQINCPNAQVGCIDVIKETFDTNGNVLTPVTQFSFSLDGTRTAVNSSDGRARFENVALGSHTVTETIPTGWTQQSVTPAGGIVNVVAGSCVTVTFKNRQTTTTTGWTITKTDHETEVEQGDTLEYEIRVRNLSSVRQTNVTIIDTLPDEVDFQDASPNESSENGRVIRWENQTFEANEERVYRVEVEVEDDADGTLLNTAEVQGITATDRTDIEEDDNEDVEIELTKTASTSEVFPGGIIDYTVRVRNTGDEPIEDLVLVDNLPADVIVIDDGDADSRSGRSLEWEIDEIDEDDDFTVRYRVSVPTYMVAGQIIRNEVCVESDDDDIDDECESVTVSVLGIIPKTGARTSSPSSEHLKPIAKDESPSDGTVPFLSLIALAGAATGAGLGFGRKMLFGI